MAVASRAMPKSTILSPALLWTRLFVKDQVRWLDVAVDDAGRMRLGKSQGCLTQELDDLRHRQRPPVFEQRSERLAFDKLHHEVGIAALVFARVIDLDDVRMRQLGNRPRLARKADQILFAGL